MSHPHEVPAYHERPRRVWYAITIVAVIAVVLGVIGFLPSEPTEGWWGHPWLAALYETLQLFFFHTPHFDQLPNFCLELARWLAAGVTLGTVFVAFGRIIRMECRRWYYNLTGDHIVICGAGWRGEALARDYFEGKLGAKPGSRKRPKILVLERDPDAPGIKKCERLGIPYLIGDASDMNELRSVGVHKARELIAVCGSDNVNIEIAVRAERLTGKRLNSTALKCYVHIANDDLRTMVRQKGLVPSGGKIEISTFGTDIYENTARWLFKHHWLDRETISATSPLQVHLLIFGFEATGEAVLAQAVRIAHFANGKKLKVTVADPQAAAKGRDYHHRHPDIAKVAEIEFRALQSHEDALVKLLIRASKEPGRLVTCVVSFPNEMLNLALAVKLGDAVKDLSLRILWWLPSHSGVGLLLSQKEPQKLFGNNVLEFGRLENVCNSEFLEQEELDHMAQKIHEFYVAEQKVEGETVANDSSLQPWKLLSENFKHSNRLAADHIEIKLRAIGCTREKSAPKTEQVDEFSPEEIKTLSRMEHARFCAERFLDGWRYADGPKDPVAKTNPTLGIPWEKLPPEEQAKDSDQVKKIPGIIESAGCVIRREGKDRETSQFAGGMIL